MGMGYIGTAAAYDLTLLMSFCSMMTFARLNTNEEVRQVWVPFNKDTFINLRYYVRFAFSGLLLFCFEEWCNQGIEFISGYLSVNEQAAMVITFSIVIMVIFAPLSFGFATSALIGASMGQNKVIKAKSIARQAIFLS
jgi:Na+-driven multidrug efflux pump